MMEFEIRGGGRKLNIGIDEHRRKLKEVGAHIDENLGKSTNINEN